MLDFKIGKMDVTPVAEAVEQKDDKELYDVIIVGSGPAGMTAAIYTARALYKTLVLEKVGAGGQMALTHNIENYPGFPDGINGYDLSMKMEEQAKRFNTVMEYATVEEIEKDDESGIFHVKTDGGLYHSKAVLIASGVSPRKLNIPGEDKFYGRGISFCGTCDGAFYKDKEIAVIGGGESALEEGMFLTRFASKVTIIHRRDQFRASKLSQARAKKNPKIEFIMDSVAESFVGDDKIEGINLRNVKSGEKSFFKTDGVFIFVGQIPNTSMASYAEKNEQGFIITDERMQSCKDGLFAAGDCCERPLKQVATAIGDGALAAHFIELYIEGLSEDEQKKFL